MYRFQTFCLCFILALTLAVPVLAQGDRGVSITADPSPALAGADVQLTVIGRGACPAFGPVEIEGNTIRVEIRTSCPFVPPPLDPFVLETTVRPALPGLYELLLVLPDGTVLATEQLQVLEEGACVPSPTIACLNDNRFRVQADFRTAGGQAGAGQAIEFTDDSGLFTFFDEENVELIVKVLDRCQSRFESFWVFSAGLTNVEVDITVTDVESGATKTYSNPLGNVFEAVLDTRAFETCP